MDRGNNPLWTKLSDRKPRRLAGKTNPHVSLAKYITRTLCIGMGRSFDLPESNAVLPTRSDRRRFCFYRTLQNLAKTKPKQTNFVRTIGTRLTDLSLFKYIDRI